MMNTQPDNTNAMTVVSDGPLLVSGDLAIEAAAGEAAEGAAVDAPAAGERVALCRCGLSANKPWCDGSHRKASFTDAGALADTGTPLEEQGGVLNISIIKDGPLRITGNLTITSGSGLDTWQGTATALCRCGLSANKPFCDGTHRKQGWSD